ncbi:MAG: hypothetical protein ACTS43_02140 [Candidatus Hodgkinia cicadicola]
MKALVWESALELSHHYDVLLIEGAGALTETNLAPFDLANAWLRKLYPAELPTWTEAEHFPQSRSREV